MTLCGISVADTFLNWCFSYFSFDGGLRVSKALRQLIRTDVAFEAESSSFGKIEKSSSNEMCTFERP